MTLGAELLLGSEAETPNLSGTRALARLLLDVSPRSRRYDPVEDHMLYWAAVFFIIALLAAFFGFGGLAAGAAGMAKILFFVFLVLAIVSLIFGRRLPT